MTSQSSQKPPIILHFPTKNRLITCVLHSPLNYIQHCLILKAPLVQFFHYFFGLKNRIRLLFAFKMYDLGRFKTCIQVKMGVRGFSRLPGILASTSALWLFFMVQTGDALGWPGYCFTIEFVVSCGIHIQLRTVFFCGKYLFSKNPTGCGENLEKQGP